MKPRRVPPDLIFDVVVFACGAAVGVVSTVLWAVHGVSHIPLALVALALVVLFAHYPLILRHDAGDIVIGFESCVLVFLLLVLGPRTAMGIWAVATTIAQVYAAHSKRAKLFNVGTTVLGGAACAGVFALLPHGSVLSPTTLLVVLIAGACYFVLDLMTTACSLAIEAHVPVASTTALRSFGLGLGCFVGVATLGYLAAVLERTSPVWTLILLAVPAATIIAAVGAFGGARIAQQRLTSLFETATSAPDWPDEAHVERALVQQAARILRKMRVELRGTPAQPDEIGAELTGADGGARHLVASSAPGLAKRRFSNDDHQALQTLAAIGQAAFNRQRLAGEMAYLARHDVLTGLANRAVLADRLDHALARRLRRIALLYLDLDGFKAVNDRLGHAVGDRLLAAVADRITRLVRPEDTAARIGGDEFAVLLEDVRRAEDAEGLAGRLLAALHEPFVLDGRQVRVGASIGVSFAQRQDSGEEMLRNADTAMYQAKGTGRGRVQVFQPSMRIETLRRLELEDELAAAVEQGTIAVRYQPLVELAEGRIEGFEALARWTHPRLGVIPPDVFIPLAESMGLIPKLGAQVLTRAHSAARELSVRSGRPVTIGVNVSPLQLDDGQLVEAVRRLVAADPTVPLVLELTEGTVLADSESTTRVLCDLQDAGAVLAVDDFGVGYASVSYLRRLPVELVKIDRSFIEALDDPRTVALVEGIVAMTTAMGMRVVAEGIEEPGAVDVLRQLGCHMGQGYLFSPAVPLTDAMRLLAAGSLPVSEDAGLVAG